ncbi:MAG: hypothetical protein WC551_11055 [Patescibacteria group bacterium]
MKKAVLYSGFVILIVLCLGAVSETSQMGWSPLRSAAVTADDTALDGTTENYTFAFGDKPASAIRVHPNWNNGIVHFAGTDAANETCNYKLYGWRENGPAMLICSGTFTLGAAVTGATNTFYADTITVTDTWPTTVVTSDADGNNRVASLAFDMIGCSWVYLEIDIPAASQVASANGYISGF